MRVYVEDVAAWRGIERIKNFEWHGTYSMSRAFNLHLFGSLRSLDGLTLSRTTTVTPSVLYSINESVSPSETAFIDSKTSFLSFIFLLFLLLLIFSKYICKV